MKTGKNYKKGQKRMKTGKNYKKGQKEDKMKTK